MNAVSLFRWLLVASIVLTIIGVASEYATASMLPEPVQDIIKSDMEGEITQSDIIMLGIGAPALILLLIGYIGLFRLKTWGRNCFIFASIMIYLITPLLGDFLMTSITFMLYDLASVTYGAVIAMAYLPPVCHRFTAKQAGQSS